jgi:hypothetical protein
MTIKLKDAKDLIKSVETDIVRVMDSVGYHLFNYSLSYIHNAYVGECSALWPMVINGEEAKDPVTNENFTDKENPAVIAQLVRSSIRRNDNDRKIKVWVDTEGQPNDEKLQRAGRMMEVFGCKPWSKLKSELDSVQGILKIANRARKENRYLSTGDR